MSSILEIKNLKTYFRQRKKILVKRPPSLKAVDGVTLSIKRGTTLGLVGESGCGKTTLGKSILNLYPQCSGEIYYRHEENSGPVNLLGLDSKEEKRMRKRIQIIFQDPYSSLNPRLTIKDILLEGMIVHGLISKSSERMIRVRELLNSVKLPDSAADKYPHEFSGGQRQRIGIARALSLNPDFIICDEAVSALDVSVQAQILNLLKQLQIKYHLTYLFISHDLSVVRYISNSVAVMYLGRIVEYGSTNEIFDNPRHPYTKALLSAIPGKKGKKRIVLKGDVPSPTNPPEGCSFHPRCEEAKPECSRWIYSESRLSDDHRVYCVKYGQGFQ